MEFRLVTYNIHKGIGGVDRRYRPERIIETLGHYAPDIVLLQEVDDGARRSRRHRQVDLIGEALGLRHRAYQRNVSLREGHYGNALLSRYPLRDIQHLELTVPLKKRRRALVAHCILRLEEHQRTVLVYNFHLGLAGYERRIQIRRFLDSETLRRTHHDTAVIAAGDFNDGRGALGRRLLEPSGFRLASGAAKTFPAVRPWRPLDHVFYRGGLSLHRCFPGHIKVSRMASDHLPLVADFEIH
jgi:endonuclease/exonuclease/phosphatase family metal-dependent hydrolase